MRGAVGQEIDDVTGLEIDEDRAVRAPSPQRPVVDAEDARRLALGQLRRPHQLQQGVRARRHGQAGGETRTSLTAGLRRYTTLAPARRRVRCACRSMRPRSGSAKVRRAQRAFWQ